MGKALTTKTAVAEPADWKKEVRQAVAEIAQANERMEKRQAEIKKLKAETRVILDALKAA